jgi:exportin-T
MSSTRPQTTLLRYNPVIRNKFSHTLTLFFLCTYTEQWPTFFSDLFTLIQTAEQSTQTGFNRHLSLLFFHIVLEISGEVADQLIKSARSLNAQRHGRDGRVRDGVRERDAAKINEAVLTIVSDRARRLSELRKTPDVATDPKELDHIIEVVDWGVRAFSSYVGASTVLSLHKHGIADNIIKVGLTSTLRSHQVQYHSCSISWPIPPCRFG